MAKAEETIQKKEAQQIERAERTRATRVYTPDVDIIERKDDILVVADMPGVDETSVDVTLEKNIVTLYGKVQPEVPEGGSPVYVEYGIGDYERTFTLSDEIDRDKIRATVKNGTLHLLLPKAEAAKTRKIQVTAGP
jgi:HSP20 family molecular chaperone IbpA